MGEGGGRRPAEPKQARQASSTLQLLTNCTTACPTMGLPQITKRSTRCVTSTASDARGAVYFKHPRPWLFATRPQSWWRTAATGTAEHCLTYVATTCVLPAAGSPLGARTDHAHTRPPRKRRSKGRGEREKDRCTEKKDRKKKKRLGNREEPCC